MKKKDLFHFAETRHCKMVFPGLLNANETLFGGEIMKWMDEVAFITASRATRQRMFTAKVEQVEFLSQVAENSIVEIVGKVSNAGSVKLRVLVELYTESLYDNDRCLAARALFVLIALNEKDKVTRLLLPEFEDSFSVV